jgi:hemolysin III
VIALLFAGGVLYTGGIVFHRAERLPYAEAIWHGFVAAAATCHYAAILQAVALA